MSFVDRPYSRKLMITEGKGKGREVIAQLSWGHDNDPLPIRVSPIVERNGDDLIIDTIDGPFKSIDEAESRAVQCATDWYNRGNV